VFLELLANPPIIVEYSDVVIQPHLPPTILEYLEFVLIHWQMPDMIVEKTDLIWLELPLMIVE
jgi:hypothetical protein